MKQLFTVVLICATTLAWGSGESDFFSLGYAQGGAEYLKLPRHAHSAALSGAVTAWQEEMAGFQYNPSLLDIAGVEYGYPITATYSFMSLDRKHISADASFALGRYLVGALSLSNFGVDNFEARDEYGNNLEDNFDYKTITLAASVAGRLSIPLSLGATIRYISEQMEYEMANGFGLDIGAYYRPNKYLAIGMSGLNIASWLFWTTGHNDIVLPSGRLGVAGRLLDSTLTMELDISKTAKQPVDLSFGVQYKLFNVVSLRAGTSTSLDVKERDYRDFDFTLGVGMRYAFFGFDYACPITSSKLGISHKISITGKIPHLK